MGSFPTRSETYQHQRRPPHVLTYLAQLFESDKVLERVTYLADSLSVIVGREIHVGVPRRFSRVMPR